MNNLSRAGATYRSYLFCLLAASFTGLSARAQRSGDTIIVSPQKPADTVTINSKMVKTLLDSLNIQVNINPDTSSISVADSESFSPASTKPDEVVFRSVPDSVVTSWKNDKDFAYANDPSWWIEDQDQYKPSPFLVWLLKVLSSRWFRYFLYGLLITALVYIVFRIVKENNMRLFYRSPGKGAVPGGEASPLEEDLDAQLKGALEAGDHRLAVRYLYLKALKRLNDGEHIRYHMQATNQEYVRQLGGSPLSGPFRFLTGAYDRVWYGEFVMMGGQFERLHQYFENFYKSITES
jgi:hypothetical protein